MLRRLPIRTACWLLQLTVSLRVSGYTVVLIIMCVIREFLGNGTFGGGLLNGGDGIRIIPEGYPLPGPDSAGRRLHHSGICHRLLPVDAEPYGDEKREEAAK